MTGTDESTTVVSSAEAQEKLEKKRKNRNFAFREWLFEFFPKYVAKNSQLITEMEYLRDTLMLSPAEKIIFRKALEALYALQAVQAEMVEKFKVFSFDEFSQKSTEEQVEIIERLYNEESLQALKEVAFPAFNLSRYLDQIFTLHREEIQALPQKKKFSFLRTEVDFQIQARVMQGVTRIPLLADAVHPYLDSSQEEFANLCARLGEMVLYVNELDRVNALCHNHDVSDIAEKADRAGFLEEEKAEQFLSFLGTDTRKVGYFKLLKKLFEGEPNALKENQKNIKKDFPFMAKALEALLREAEGYKLALMSSLPKVGKPEEKVVYLAKDGDTLRYVVLNPKGKKVEGTIGVKVESDLSLDVLNTLKEQILEQTSLQGAILGKEEEERKIKEKMGLAFNTIKSLLWDVLESDFIAFTQHVENRSPRQSLDIDLEDEDESIATQTQLKRRSAILEKPVAVMGKVRETLKRRSFLGQPKQPSTALEAKEPLMSFTEHAQMAVETVRIFQEVEKEYKDDPNLDPKKRTQIEGWEAIYKRKKAEYTGQDKDQSEERLFDAIPSNGFREGDSIEILHKGSTAFEIIPADEKSDASGAKVIIPPEGHNEENIDVAVLYMVKALAKKGQKEVSIGIDLNAPGADEIALLYAQTILKHSAIPVFKLNDKKLSAEETKQKLTEIYSRITDDVAKKKYETLVEQHGCAVERIENLQKGDALFLKDFEEFMKKPGLKLTADSYMKVSSMKKKLGLEGVLSKLGEIALVNHNLTQDEFFVKILSCACKMQHGTAILLTENDLESIKFKLKNYSLQRKAMEPEISNDVLTMKLFSLAFAQVRERINEYAVFIAAFDKLLQQPELLVQNSAITMQDPTTNEMLNLQQILTRLTQIAFVNNGMKKESFVDRITTLGLATLAPSVRAILTEQNIAELKGKLLEKVDLHLKHTAAERDEEVFAAHLIDFAQHELAPGHTNEETSRYGLFAKSCAASVREDKPMAAQPAPVLVGGP